MSPAALQALSQISGLGGSILALVSKVFSPRSGDTSRGVFRVILLGAPALAFHIGNLSHDCCSKSLGDTSRARFALNSDVF